MTDQANKFADAVFLSVKGYIASEMAALTKRLASLEAREPQKGEKGDRGEDGKSVDVSALTFQIIDAAARAVEALPKPKDGKDYDQAVLDAAVKREVAAIPRPENGKDADADAIAARVLEKVTKALEQIPTPKDGRDGLDGKDGRDGIDGKNGADGRDGKDGKDGSNGLNGKDASEVTDERLSPLVKMAVARAMQMMPEPPPGRDGKDADPEVVRALVEDAIQKMPKPRADPELVRAEVQKAVAAIPRPRDGVDGLSFETIRAEIKEGRTFTLKLAGNGREVETDVKFVGMPLDRGVYKSGGNYEIGDGVTYAGSFWIAQKDTNKSPSEDPSAWRLAVKRGRDGKDRE